jgi:hypothetical protein
MPLGDSPAPSPTSPRPPSPRQPDARAELATKTSTLRIVALATGLAALPFFVPLSLHPLALVAVTWNLGALVNAVVLFQLAGRLGSTPLDAAEVAASLRKSALLVLFDAPVPFLAIGVFLANSHTGDYGPSPTALAAIVAFLLALLLVPIWSGGRLVFLFRFAKRLDQGTFGLVVRPHPLA